MTDDHLPGPGFRTLILAAGRGRRLGGGDAQMPKVLLEFGGETLLARHLRLLEAVGADRVSIVVGYRREAIAAELERIGRRDGVELIENNDWQQGSVVSLDRGASILDGEAPVVLMDGDVIYDHRLLQRLLGGRHPGTLLLDREIEPGDEPVKICVAGGHRIVDFAKRPVVASDWHGESVGFFRFAPALARRLAERGPRGGPGRGHHDGIRGADPLPDPGGCTNGTLFGFEDVTGLPWTEIDFMEDVTKANALLPSLAA